ncbi:hypothetical protein KHA90_08035 [Flavobacterium psychroterrae]|uniref:Uncharacterized protein n=1 Tax=Flavobacterium psychroterrae TaxID=2133767 RepID=A0ABS5P9J6_9FLAO|nr:hypothetical protein [Flavobacterium psychroterrae]MBS7230970.1 hypothetical protein [Flavobacterium psychroterrae]
MMSNIYPLEWLDSLILQTLNPKRNNISKLSDSELAYIAEHIVKESKSVQIRIKNEIFSLLKKREIRLQVRKYHSNLTYLLDTQIEIRKNHFAGSSELSQIADIIIANLEELISFLENRFANYLSLDERVPITYLMITKNELLLKLNILKSKYKAIELYDRSIAIVINKAVDFVKSFSRRKITYRQIIYHKELLKSLQDLESRTGQTHLFSSVDELLIQKNFNSEEYVNHLVSRLKTHLNQYVLLDSRIDELLLNFKEFNQLQSDEKISLDPTHLNLKNTLDNWFKHEIVYLERKLAAETQSNHAHESLLLKDDRSKIECDLSADQIALILRAADEARIIKARSMTLVFQTIVPHLSTSFKKELSYQSVRSKSYNAEENDKQAAIASLEKMIKKIRTY